MSDTEYTPTMEQVRNGFHMYELNANNRDGGGEAFARALASHDADLTRKAKAEALREAADALPRIEGTQITRQQGAAYWLRDRADVLEGNNDE